MIQLLVDLINSGIGWVLCQILFVLIVLWDRDKK